MGVCICGEVRHYTDKAVLLDIDGHGETWVPRSVIEGCPDDDELPGLIGDEVEWEVRTWWAQKEGLD